MALAFACLVTLVIVLADGDDDLLATVALALAIFAFTLQIAFLLVQLRVAGEQDRRSADLFRETSSVLTKIDERSAATVEVIREQFDFVLRHALGQGSPPAAATLSPPMGDGDEDVESEEGSAATREEIETIVSRALQTHLNADLLSRWREISNPRPDAPAQSPEESQRLLEAFTRQVGLVLQAGVGSHGGHVAPSPTGRGFVATVGDRRVLVAVRRWTRLPLSSFAKRQFDRVREQMQAANADHAVLVTPSSLGSLSQRRDRIEQLRATAEPVEILGLDEFVARLAEGWPGPQR